MVHFMMMIGRMRVLQGSRDPLEEFLESQGGGQLSLLRTRRNYGKQPNQRSHKGRATENTGSKVYEGVGRRGRLNVNNLRKCHLCKRAKRPFTKSVWMFF